MERWGLGVLVAGMVTGCVRENAAFGDTERSGETGSPPASVSSAAPSTSSAVATGTGASGDAKTSAEDGTTAAPPSATGVDGVDETGNEPPPSCEDEQWFIDFPAFLDACGQPRGTPVNPAACVRIGPSDDGDVIVTLAEGCDDPGVECTSANDAPSVRLFIPQLPLPALFEDDATSVCGEMWLYGYASGGDACYWDAMMFWGDEGELWFGLSNIPGEALPPVPSPAGPVLNETEPVAPSPCGEDNGCLDPGSLGVRFGIGQDLALPDGVPVETFVPLAVNGGQVDTQAVSVYNYGLDRGLDCKVRGRWAVTGEATLFLFQ